MTKPANASTRNLAKKPTRSRPQKTLTLSADSVDAIDNMCKHRGVRGLSALVDLLIAEEKIRVEGGGARRD